MAQSNDNDVRTLCNQHYFCREILEAFVSAPKLFYSNKKGIPNLILLK